MKMKNATVFYVVSLFFIGLHSSPIFSECKGQKSFIEDVQEIKITGYPAHSISEISGLAWRNDLLFLLPQFPVEKPLYDVNEKTAFHGRVPSEKSFLAYFSKIAKTISNFFSVLKMELFRKAAILGFSEGIRISHSITLFAIEKSRIIKRLKETNHAAALKTLTIPVKVDGDLLSAVENYDESNSIRFEGFEAIAFDEEKVFAAIEARNNRQMLGFWIKGSVKEMNGDKNLMLKFDAGNLKKIRMPNLKHSEYRNKSYESLFVANGSPIFIFEGKKGEGKKVFYRPETDKLFEINGVKHRITDVTSLDDDNRFWGIQPAHDRGKSYAENIIELKYFPKRNKIEKTCRSISLRLKKYARNWEGIVRIKDENIDGFLIATDYYPKQGTIFAFVRNPFE